jgi:site-specific DNA-methyltransferase (adenine-specific)
MKSLQKIMKPNATAYIFSGWNHLEDILREARLNGLHTINHLIWKYQFGVFTKKRYVTSHYHILLFAKDLNNYYFNKMENYPEDVWDIKRKYRRGEVKNATTLPLDVVKKCIEFGSKPGDLVFDPFMGMGTTAVAAKSIWRHYFGFEINEKIKPIIQNRIDDMPVGYEYTSLEEKIKEIHCNIQKKYPSAYQLYLKEIGERINVESETRGRNTSGGTI